MGAGADMTMRFNTTAGFNAFIERGTLDEWQTTPEQRAAAWQVVKENCPLDAELIGKMIGLIDE